MSTTTTNTLTAGTWVIDPAHSTLGFSVRHLMVSKVRGRFTDFSGRLVIAEDGSASAEAEIRVDSVTTDNEQRDAHLRTADFFQAEQFPVATFKSTGFRVKGEDFVVDGEFTIRGVTKPVSLDVEFLGVNPGMGQGPVAGFEAKTVINRRDFGITIDMPLPDGGAVIGDKITLTLEVEVGLRS
ncbi:YceI family protein [Streptomyces gardneri]|uniref:YceI family protein n=1 Tax=Nocardia TaxID=1817 RepID=UPI001358985C|nr:MULTISPECIES: YceI family protein [Nocardia]MBF6168033.1 YceI family protein [Streptomyces gardneri]MBF6206812.1 YceI family protein [Streptomyces gardneri]UAK32816.1 YceI family protein [Nocardia asteroides]